MLVVKNEGYGYTQYRRSNSGCNQYGMATLVVLGSKIVYEPNSKFTKEYYMS